MYQDRYGCGMPSAPNCITLARWRTMLPGKLSWPSTSAANQLGVISVVVGRGDVSVGESFQRWNDLLVGLEIVTLVDLQPVVFENKDIVWKFLGVAERQPQNDPIWPDRLARDFLIVRRWRPEARRIGGERCSKDAVEPVSNDRPARGIAPELCRFRARADRSPQLFHHSRYRDFREGTECLVIGARER